MTVFFILSRIASNDVLEFYQPQNYWICIFKELLLWNLAPLKSYNKKEKSLRHVVIVAKFLDDNYGVILWVLRVLGQGLKS